MTIRTIEGSEKAEVAAAERRSIMLNLKRQILFAGLIFLILLACRAKANPPTEAEFERYFETLISALKDDDPDVRSRAALALRKLGSAVSAIVDQLTLSLRDDKATIRSQAAQALGEIGPSARRAVPALTTALKKDESATVRAEAALALGLIEAIPDSGISALIEALGDSDTGVRRQSAVAIGMLGPKAKGAVPALIDVLQNKQLSTSDEGRQFRERAAISLGRIGPDAVNAVQALLSVVQGNEDVGLQSCCLWSLSGIRSRPDIVLPVAAAAINNNKRPQLRANAARAIGVFGREGKALVSDLLKALDVSAITDETEAEFARCCVLDALGSIGEAASSAARAIGDIFLDPKQSRAVRLSAIQALKGIGPGASVTIPGLAAYLVDPNNRHFVRETIDVLGSIHNGQAVPILIMIAKDAEHRYRVDALRALEAIGTEAKDAIPVLKQLATDPSREVSEGANRALRRINR
jgi:HEAT repeat protein